MRGKRCQINEFVVSVGGVEKGALLTEQFGQVEVHHAGLPLMHLAVILLHYFINISIGSSQQRSHHIFINVNHFSSRSSCFLPPAFPLRPPFQESIAKLKSFPPSPSLGCCCLRSPLWGFQPSSRFSPFRRTGEGGARNGNCQPVRAGEGQGRTAGVGGGLGP